MGLLGAIATGVGAGLEGVSKNLDRESVYQQQMALLREKLNIEREGKNTDRQEGQVRFQEARGNLLKDVAGSQYGAAMDAYKNAEGIDGMSAEEVQQAGTQHVQGLIDSYRPDAKTSAQIDARAAIEVGDRDRGVLANQSLQALQRDEQVEASTLLRKELEAGRNARNEADNRARLDAAFLRGNGRGTGSGGGGGGGSQYDMKALASEKKEAEKIVYGKEFNDLAPEQQTFWKGKLSDINQNIARAQFFTNRSAGLTDADKKSLIAAYISGDGDRASKAIKMIDFAFGHGTASKILVEYVGSLQLPGDGMEPQTTNAKVEKESPQQNESAGGIANQNPRGLILSGNASDLTGYRPPETALSRFFRSEVGNFREKTKAN